MAGDPVSAVIGPASAGDLPDAEELLAGADLVRDGFATCVAAGTAVVARAEDGRLMGVVATERFGGDVLLRSLAVSAACRGRGLGARLVARALDDARAAGAREGWLLTETAEVFFAARGWTAVDRSAAPPAVAASVEFASACPVSARAMRRPL